MGVSLSRLGPQCGRTGIDRTRARIHTKALRDPRRAFRFSWALRAEGGAPENDATEDWSFAGGRPCGGRPPFSAIQGVADQVNTPLRDTMLDVPNHLTIDLRAMLGGARWRRGPGRRGGVGRPVWRR